MRDSTGAVKLKDGNGYYTQYNETFSEINDEGFIKNDKREGLWKGIDKDTRAVFQEEYKNGEIVSGKATKNGKISSYFGKRAVQPQFPGGDAMFYKFLSKHVKYPSEERDKNIQGRVILTFYVEEDGKITGISLLRGVSVGLNNEAIRALRDSSPWSPGVKYGFPERVRFSVPVAFALSEE
jgi:TonB family protein